MRILVMVDYWMPKATTNAICVKNILDVLKQNGNETFVCAYGDANIADSEEDGTRISFVKPSLSRRLLNKSRETNNAAITRICGAIGKTLNRIRRTILLPVYPIVSVRFARRWSKKVSNLITRWNIDCLVSVIAPDDALYAGYLSKKSNPTVTWIPYYIDNGTNVLPGTSFEALKHYLQEKARKWENKILHSAAGIIVMKGHERYYRESLSEENAKKLYVANIPLFVNSPQSAKVSKERHTTEVWMYAGSMSGVYYDPHVLIKLFEEYQSNVMAELKIFGPTDQVEYLQEKNLKNGIRWYGTVAHSDLENEYMKADVLVYYKNGTLDSISGKFFEYLRYGKTIVYIGNPTDINATQVRKYKKGAVVPIKRENKDLELLCNQVKNCRMNDTDESELLETFKESTPSFTADIIKSIFEQGT